MLLLLLQADNLVMDSEYTKTHTRSLINIENFNFSQWQRVLDKLSQKYSYYLQIILSSDLIITPPYIKAEYKAFKNIMLEEKSLLKT